MIHRLINLQLSEVMTVGFHESSDTQVLSELLNKAHLIVGYIQDLGSADQKIIMCKQVKYSAEC